MTSTGDRAGVIILRFAVLIGVVGAFLGLDTDGFALDEFFTHWIIGTDHRIEAVLARALTDVHPPLYYLIIFAFSEVFGTSEAALRLFSVVAALGALAVFYVGTRHVFTPAARLFAVAVATVSSEWLLQSHYARSNSLAMLLAAVLLGLALALIRRDRAGQPATQLVAGLAGVMLFGAFVHFYMLFVALAVLAMLFVYCPRRRVVLAGLGIALTLLVGAYFTLIVTPRTVILMDQSWIGDSFTWYLRQTEFAVLRTVSWHTVVPVALCTGLATVILLRRRWTPITIASLDPRLICVAVPLLVALAGIVSSQLSRPNYTDRNLLLASPFLWGSLALIYDAGISRLDAQRGIAAGLVALLVLPAAARVVERFQPFQTPFRTSAEWIMARPGCRGRTIPVFIDRLTKMQPGQAELHARHEYGHYLAGAATVAPVYIEDVTAGGALPPAACGIVGWAAHYIHSRQQAEHLQRYLATRLDVPVTMTEFPVFRDSGNTRSAFIYTVTPDG